jgi:hypothetical protein
MYSAVRYLIVCISLFSPPARLVSRRLRNEHPAPRPPRHGDRTAPDVRPGGRRGRRRHAQALHPRRRRPEDARRARRRRKRYARALGPTGIGRCKWDGCAAVGAHTAAALDCTLLLQSNALTRVGAGFVERERESVCVCVCVCVGVCVFSLRMRRCRVRRAHHTARLVGVLARAAARAGGGRGAVRSAAARDCLSETSAAEPAPLARL